MKKVLKLSEWQSPSKIWRVADTTTWTRWWVIPRMLEMGLTDYIQMLLDKYNATIDSFTLYEDKRNSLLSFHFKSYKDAHQFLLDMNRIARNKKFYVSEDKVM